VFRFTVFRADPGALGGPPLVGVIIWTTKSGLCKNPPAEGGLARSCRDTNPALRDAFRTAGRMCEHQNQDITLEESSLWLENRVW
jgi:hypothetical protein